MDDEGDDDSSKDDEDRDEYQPDSEPEEPGDLLLRDHDHDHLNILHL
jgi:hypothetical protein